MGLLNPFTLKKYIALALGGILCTTTYVLLLTLKGQLIAVIGYVGALVLSILIGTLILSNPFQDMLEGSGIMFINMDSTGIITPFICKVESPYIKGRIGNKQIQDVFDREATMHLGEPRWKGAFMSFFNKGDVLDTADPNKPDSKPVVAESSGLTIRLDEELYNKARMALYHWPVIVYNAQIKSVVTKDFLSNMEKDTFAEHSIIYLNRKLEELSSYTRDFGRAIVDLTHKHEGGLPGGMWVWIILGILVIAMIALFGPKIFAAIQGPAQAAVGTAGQAIGNIPKPAVVQT